jgi:hypothetical protein
MGVRLPVDLESIIYSQERLNEYFGDHTQEKRLVIAQRHGKEWLELKNAKDLTIWETIAASNGFGPAGFRGMVQFCADRCLWHKNLKIMIQTYNAQHVSFKQVNAAAAKVLNVAHEVSKDIPKDAKVTAHFLLRAVAAENLEVLHAIKKAPWQEVKNALSPALFLEFASKMGSLTETGMDILGQLLEIISKAPQEDREKIYAAANNEGIPVVLLMLMKASKIPHNMFKHFRAAVNQQDAKGQTALMRLLACEADRLEDIEKLLNLNPNLLLKDREGRGLFFYLCDGVNGIRDNEDKKIDLIINVVKKLGSIDREEVLRNFFTYKNSEGRSEYIQCIHDSSITRGALVARIRRDFDWKEKLGDETDLEGALSQSRHREFFENIVK